MTQPLHTNNLVQNIAEDFFEHVEKRLGFDLRAVLNEIPASYNVAVDRDSKKSCIAVALLCFLLIAHAIKAHEVVDRFFDGEGLAEVVEGMKRDLPSGGIGDGLIDWLLGATEALSPLTQEEEERICAVVAFNFCQVYCPMFLVEKVTERLVGYFEEQGDIILGLAAAASNVFMETTSEEVAFKALRNILSLFSFVQMCYGEDLETIIKLERARTFKSFWNQWLKVHSYFEAEGMKELRAKMANLVVSLSDKRRRELKRYVQGELANPEQQVEDFCNDGLLRVCRQWLADTSPYSKFLGTDSDGEVYLKTSSTTILH